MADRSGEMGPFMLSLPLPYFLKCLGKGNRFRFVGRIGCWNECMSHGGARADRGEYGVASVNRGWIRAIEVRKSPPRYPHGVFELYLGH